jgi:hypothetical protein
MSCLPAGALLVLLAACGCAHQRPTGPGGPTAPLKPPTAAELPPPDAIPGTFTVRQKLAARSAHGGGSFEAVLQKQPGQLTLMGLTPYGSRAFLLRQTAADVQFTSYVPRELPFPPTFMLLDIHRVFDAWLGPPLPAGQRAQVRDGERIEERWRDGKLVTRTFTRAAADPPGTITISYAGDGPAGLAARITIDNARLGYWLGIDTFPLVIP